MAEQREEARVFTKSLGFNILLLPAAQDPGEFHVRDASRHFFTSEEVRTLGDARLTTLNHLLPVLRQRIREDDGDLVRAGYAQTGTAIGQGPGPQIVVAIVRTYKQLFGEDHRSPTFLERCDSR